MYGLRYRHIRIKDQQLNLDMDILLKPFEDVSKPSPTINAMEIQYACVYKRSSKPVIKGSRVETIEDARKEYKQLLEEGWKKTSIFKSYF